MLHDSSRPAALPTRRGRSRPLARLAALLLATGLALPLAACSQPSGGAPASKPAAAAGGPPAASSSAAPTSPASATAPSGSAPPVEIRVGHGFAAEENLWLMAARPDLTPNQDKAYRLTMTAFRGNADRLNAFEAGQIDLATSATPSTLFAAEQGVPLKILASIVREKQGSFNTTYLALEDAGIRSPADVRGKTVGIVDFKSATELWARAAIEGAGLNPDRDVSFVVVPFPAWARALRAKRIDVGVFPQPFVTIEQGRGGVVQVWTAKTGVPFEEELLDLIVRPEFAAQNREALRAFLADFVAATRYYLDHTEEAKLALIDKGYVQIPPEVYVKLADSYREPTGRVTLEGIEQEQDLHLKLGWQRTKLNIRDLVDMSLLP